MLLLRKCCTSLWLGMFFARLVAAQSFTMSTLYRITPSRCPTIPRSRFVSEKEPRKILRHLFKYVFLFTWRRFLLCTFNNTLDRLRNEQIRMLKTEPLASSMHLSKKVSLKIKPVIHRYDLVCFQSRIEIHGWSNQIPEQERDSP